MGIFFDVIRDCLMVSLRRKVHLNLLTCNEIYEQVHNINNLFESSIVVGEESERGKMEHMQYFFICHIGNIFCYDIIWT